MNVIKYLLASIILCIAVFLSSCNDPSVIGAELLGEELIKVNFTDTSSMTMKTVKVDSVRTYAPFAPLFNYMLGDVDDPVFGYSEASLYTQINIGLNTFIETNVIVNGVLDSAVLVLNYDTDGFFGKENSLQTLTVHELLDDFEPIDTFYSNMNFMFDPSPVGDIQFIPSFDSITLTPHGQPDTMITVGPQIRIPLTSVFAEEMLDTMFFQNDSLFTDRFKGLHIKSTSSEEALFGINLGTAPAESELNRLMLYVTEDDTVNHDIQIDLRGKRHTEFIHDYSSSIVEPFIGSETMGDSLLFVQGMSGVDFEMDIPYIRDFDNVLINKVELEFVMADLIEDDTTMYTAIPNMVVSRDNEEGNSVFIEDVNFAINPNLNFQELLLSLRVLFGGFVDEDSKDGFSFRKYTMNVTEEVITVINDSSKSTNFKISSFLKSERPNRSVIFGPKHSMFPARLKITFTEP